MKPRYLIRKRNVMWVWVSRGTLFRRLTICGCSVCLIAGIVVATTFRAREPLRIGFLGELEGRGANFGWSGRNGALLAVDEVNARGGINGHRVDLIIANYQNGNELNTVERLEQQGVVAIVGPMTTFSSQVLVHPDSSTNLVMVSPTSESSQLAELDDHFFRVVPSSKASVKLLVKHMLEERNIKRASVVRDTDNDAFTRGWQEEFESEYDHLGGHVLDVIPISSSAQILFSELASRVAASGAEGVLLLTNTLDTALFCQQVAKQKIKIVCFSTSWASTPILVQLGGKSVEGLTWVQGSSYDDSSATYLDFCRSYQLSFGKSPDYASLHAYEATLMLLRALAGDADVPLEKRLVDLGSFVGPQDSLVIDEHGDIVRDLHLLTIRNGKIVSINQEMEPVIEPQGA